MDGEHSNSRKLSISLRMCAKAKSFISPACATHRSKRDFTTHRISWWSVALWSSLSSSSKENHGLVTSSAKIARRKWMGGREKLRNFKRIAFVKPLLLHLLACP
jgi:hypothetical protein